MNPYDITPILDRLTSMEKRAFDLIFSPEHPPKTVIDGKLSPIPIKELKTLSPYQIEMLVLTLLKDKPRALETFMKTGSVDISLSLDQVGAFRINIFRQRNMPVVVMRAIPPSIPSFDVLGLPTGLSRLVEISGGGLTLVTGQSGSGKTTTMAAMINYINQKSPLHVITIEDPIEYIYTPNKCLIHQRELGADANHLEDAIRGALRQAPQVLMISHLRGQECIEMALEAAETGCHVFSTLSAPDPVRAVEYLTGSFPPEQEALIRNRLSQSLNAIVSQRLVTKGSGQGRLPIAAILKMNSRAKRLIRENGPVSALDEAMRDGAMDGMQTFDMDLDRLVKAGAITREQSAQYRTGGAATRSARPAAAKTPPKDEKSMGTRELEMGEELPILGLDDK